MWADIDLWARIVQSDQDIPSTFREDFILFSAKQSQFPYTVFAPPYKWGFRKRNNPKLIAVAEHKIFYAEKDKSKIIIKEFLFEDINYIERGTLLLYSWIKISGNIKKELTTVMIEYNSVVKPIFENCIENVRAMINHIDPFGENNELYDKELKKFDNLSNTDYKFMNYSKNSILKGQIVNGFFYQPVIFRKSLNLFKHIQIFPCILILTQTELIIIKEDEASKGQVRYGGIRTYIPLSRIIDCKLSIEPKATFTILTIKLWGDESLNFKFSSVKVELESFIKELRKKES